MVVGYQVVGVLRVPRIVLAFWHKIMFLVEGVSVWCYIREGTPGEKNRYSVVGLFSSQVPSPLALAFGAKAKTKTNLGRVSLLSGGTVKKRGPRPEQSRTPNPRQFLQCRCQLLQNITVQSLAGPSKFLVKANLQVWRNAQFNPKPSNHKP